MRISDWSSDVCSSDLLRAAFFLARVFAAQSAPENSSEIPMQFSQLLSAMRGADGEWQVDVPADWQQGRTLLGGLQAALAVRAMRGLVRSEERRVGTGGVRTFRSRGSPAH